MRFGSSLRIVPSLSGRNRVESCCEIGVSKEIEGRADVNVEVRKVSTVLKLSSEEVRRKETKGDRGELYDEKRLDVACAFVACNEVLIRSKEY